MKYFASALFLLLSFSGYCNEGHKHEVADKAVTTSKSVIMQTNLGNIVIELNSAKAPKTVDNFLHYVEEGFYDGTIFHRVIGNFMIQGGGFNKQYEQKKSHDPIPNEADNGLKNTRGTIAMARTSDPHSATAQFFINVVDNQFLDFTAKNNRGWGYAVFGKVTEGMEVVDKIRQVKTGRGGPFRTDVPKTQVVIEKVTVKP
ncbi:MAG TPA: peptidyl-prolyl cis-trans isomerase [Thioploca sp.]|nr:peptidyl-prolyl cis-trans isomerase [Thioploca sp.]